MKKKKTLEEGYNPEIKEKSVEFESNVMVNPGDSTSCETGLGSGEECVEVGKISGCPGTPGVPSFGGLMPFCATVLSNGEVNLRIEWMDQGAQNS